MGRAEEVLKGLASLREENMLCDVQLEAAGQLIPAHKAVLAASSSYFKAMFLGKFRETTEKVIPMKEISSVGLKSVIESIYTTKITLVMRNIEDIFPVSHLLQMNDIVNECIQWMRRNITKGNCFKFLRIAEKFNVENLEKTITAFILKNFVDVSEMKNFESISKAALIRYLASDTLKTNINEFVAYKAAKKWILANEVPSEAAVEIMSNIRFGLIMPDQLMKEISRDSIIQVNLKCREMVEDAMLYHTNLFSQPLYEGTLNKPRGDPGLILIPTCQRGEGYNVTEDHADINFLSFLGLKNYNGNSQVDIPIVFDTMSSVQIKNFLYLFGVNNTGYQNFAKRYDASMGTWLELASVPGPAVVHPAIARSGKQIFLLGGMVVDKKTQFLIDPDHIIDSVYMFDIPQNMWSESKALPAKMAFAAAAEIQGNIYFAGGEPSEEDTSNKVWAYDIKAKVWLTKAPMNHRRCYHTLQAVDGRLYAFGGRTVDNDVYTKSIEMFDPLANQWTVLLNNAFDNHSCSSFATGNKIYLVGGHRSPFDEQVYVYDIEKNQVTRMNGKLPSDCRRNICASMILPNLL